MLLAYLFIGMVALIKSVNQATIIIIGAQLETLTSSLKLLIQGMANNATICVHTNMPEVQCAAQSENWYNSGICAKKWIPTLPADSGIVPGYSRIAQVVFYRFLLYPGIGLTKWGCVAFVRINKNKERVNTSIKHYTKRNQNIVSRLIRICIPHMFKNTDYPERTIDGLGLKRLFFWFPERCFWASSVVHVVSVE